MTTNYFKKCFQYSGDMKVLYYLFLLSGTKFYFDWILFTNPKTKNPLFSFWYEKKEMFGKDYSSRLYLAVACFIGHFMFFLPYVLEKDVLHWTNIFANIYPMFVQIYIGMRCSRILIKRKLSNRKLPS